MYHLRTLGMLDLTDTDGRSMDAILAQPKRSLLLAYLACASIGDYHRRDVLVALFWPELDSERARGALRKALHFLRATLGEAITTRGDEIGVDVSLLDSDVAQFERANREGRLEEAMSFYRGEFLPGVYAKDAPNVERWIQGEQTRLAGMAARMAWQLADLALERSELARAEHWASRAAALTPDDESSLRRRMTLLEQVDSRSAALRVYDEFATMLASDMDGAKPSDATQQLYRRIKNSIDILSTSSDNGVIIAPVIDISTIPPSPEVKPAVSAFQTVNPPKKRRFRAAILSAVAVVVAITLVSLAFTQRQSQEASTMDADASGKRMVAVMPFTIRGDRVSYLREGMVDLLSISLEGAGDVQSVDPSMLLNYLAAQDSADADIEHARATARHFHAANFVLGTIVNASGKLEARVALYETDSKSTSPLAVTTGAADEQDLASMVDNLTRDIVGEIFKSNGVRLNQLAAQTTTSLPALKSYLRGEQAMRTGQYGEASLAFAAAVGADSTFALAYYGLSMAMGWQSEGTDPGASTNAVKAVRFARGLSRHDSLLLVAHEHAWVGRPALAEQEYRQLVASYATDYEARHELAEVLFHNGAETGHAMRDSRDAFTRAAGQARLKISAMTHLARIAAIDHDTVAIDSLARLGKLEAPADPRVAEIVTLQTFVSGDSATRARVISASLARSDRDIWTLARDIATYASAWSDAESIAMLLTLPTRSDPIRALGWTTVSEIRAAAGRPAAAREAIARAAAFDAQYAAMVAGYLAGIPTLPASDAEIAAARAGLMGWKREFDPFGGHASPSISQVFVPAMRTAMLNAIDARMGRPTARLTGDSLANAWNDATVIAVRALKDSSGVPQISRQNAQILADSWQLVQSWGLLRTEAMVRLARARLLRMAGEHAEAERIASSFPAYGRTDALFRASAAQEQARNREQTGDRAGAARAYAELAWLWRDAEPSLLPIVRDAERRAARLR